MSTLFESQAPHPLADRLRPRQLADIVGQDHLLGSEGPIGRMVARKQLASMVLWGPPGCGKTTIARLLAQGTELVFEPLSAVFSGVADLRKVFDGARKRREMGQGTLLFVDEIHRFNMDIRKFLKVVGVSSQREIELAVRNALAAGKLPDTAVLKPQMTLRIPEIGLEHVIDGEIGLR